MRVWLAVSTAVLLLGGCRACKTDEIGPEGTISDGSASPSAVAPQTRLVIDPGSPLAAIHVAKRIRARLAPLGIDEQHIKIGGDRIHVDVDTKQSAACTKAIEGGRLDVFLFDDRADPFAAKLDEHAEHFEVKQETVRSESGESVSVHYLMGTPEERQALERYLADHSSGSLGLLGPVYAGKAEPQRLRSYYVQPSSSRTLRGESLSAAQSQASDGGATLTLTFDGQGKSFVRWASKQNARFVVLVDEQVVGTTQPAAEIGNGRLAIELEPRDSGAATLAAAKALVKSLEGVALSRQVKLETREER